ncbi:head maturation protease, ClpP-related [Alistipes sp.]|uniref:head maturation protease, ClpP-related n=1 Tax=Alistipes sp. TaxID=1872444 RepID=UPI003AF1D891
MNRIFNIIPGPQEDTCCILLYGVIGDGEWAEVKAQDIVEQLLAAERTYRKIDIRINSVGGEVNTGIAIFNVLHQSKADITIYIDCIAASTASFIAGCGKPVKMSRYAQMMIHQPMSCVCGNAAELKSCIAKLESIENTLCQIYAERTGKSIEEIRSTYMDGADHWLAADEALALGFVDEIYDDPHAVTFSNSLTPQQRCERYTARYLETTKDSFNTENQMIEKFKAMPIFSDCADEAAIMARITEIEGKAAAHDAAVKERDTYKAKVEQYETQAREAADAAIADEVQVAVNDGRIGEDQRERYVALLHTEKAEDARAILASLKPKRRATSIIGKAGTDGKNDPWAERFEEIRNDLKK